MKLAFKTLILCIFCYDSTAQITLTLSDCNNLRSQLSEQSNLQLKENMVYVLERMVAPGIWFSVQKNFDLSAVTYFRNIPEGIYRTKLVLNAPVKTETFISSNTVEVRECPVKSGAGYNLTKITLSPNPASEIVEVGWYPECENAKLSLYDMVGQKIISTSVAGNSGRIDLEGLHPGFYFVALEQNTTRLACEKLIVQ